MIAPQRATGCRRLRRKDDGRSREFRSRVLDPGQSPFRRFRVFLHTDATLREPIMAQATIAYLEQRYAALEREIVDTSHLTPTEDILIADLKFRKSVVADELQHHRRLAERFASAG
jgi:hypothetical protein